MPKDPNHAALERQAHEARRNVARLRASLTGVVERGIGMMGSASGFDSSKSGRLRGTITGGSVAGSAASYRDQYTLDRIRRYCQQAERNNALAGAMIDAAIDLDLQDGFITQAASEDEEWNTQADELFNAWATDARECDIRGALTLDGFAAAAIRAWFTDGDIGINLVDDGPGVLQGIEADRIRNPSGTYDSKTIAGGIETDRQGRPVHIHVAEWNDIGTAVEPKTAKLDPRNFLHLRNPMDCAHGVVRPAPQLQAVIKRLEEIDSFDEAVRTAAWVHACLAAFIAVERPDLHQGNAFGGTTEEATNPDGTSTTQRSETLEPGMIKHLKPNESIQTVNSSQPGPEYDTYLRMQVVIIGAKLGVPASVALLDGRELNLSTIRSVIQLAWRRALRRQEALRLGLYNPVRKWWTARAIARGELPFVADWTKFDVIAPPAPVMDPTVEIAAATAGIQAGLTSRVRAARTIFGHDIRDTDRERQTENQLEKELGIERAPPPGAPQANPKAGDPANPDDATDDPANPDAKPNAGGAKPGVPAPADGARGFLVGDKTLAGTLVQQVSNKTIPADSAKAVLTQMVKLSPEQANSIIDPADNFEGPPEPTQPTTPPQEGA